MERILSLVLDDRGYRSLSLMQDDANVIDNFTTKKFEDSEQIREYFKDEIKEYLQKNQKYIDLITSSTGRKFRGRIVILEIHEHRTELEFIEKRVLYKKHLVAFKEMVKDKLTMKRFLKLEKIGYNEYNLRRLVSPFLEREINYSNFKVVSRVELIRREIKRDKNNFFDILRIISKAYEQERLYRPNLKTIDAIYKEHVQLKGSKDDRNIQEDQSSNFSYNPNGMCKIDGVLYPIDEIPFDLEELMYMDTDYWPDGLGKRK